jgi:hypothetical protein
MPSLSAGANTCPVTPPGVLKLGSLHRVPHSHSSGVCGYVLLVIPVRPYLLARCLSESSKSMSRTTPAVSSHPDRVLGAISAS